MKLMEHEERMVEYLQSMMDHYQYWNREYHWEEKAKDGTLDEREQKLMHDELIRMIACKEMVENLIGLPVNLKKDGRVTVGY